MNYTKGWMTLNRSCNLRCNYCYAKNTGYKAGDNLDLNLAKQIIDIFSDLKFRHVTLIGGEPTVYPHLFTVLNMLNKKGLKTGFLSNGILYSNLDFVKKLYEHNIKMFSISLKGTNCKTFYDTTGIDDFNTVIEGLKNCLKFTPYVTVFFVVSQVMIDDLLPCLELLKSIGVNKFHFSFIYNFDTTPGYKGFLEKDHPKNIVYQFKNIYDRINVITSGNFKVFPTFPACIWGKDFIQLLNDRKQLSFGCQLKEQDDLIFDSEGNIIPCNAMYPIKLGKLNKDFFDSKSLIKHSETIKVTSIYQKYSTRPSSICKTCSVNQFCDACACQWSNYSFEQLLNT